MFKKLFKVLFRTSFEIPLATEAYHVTPFSNMLDTRYLLLGVFRGCLVKLLTPFIEALLTQELVMLL